MVDMVVGKILRGQDNRSFMHEEYPYKCKVCNYPIKQVINPNFKLVKKNFDISYTYDGYLIVSKKFKQFCEQIRYSNIVFIQLPKEPNFFCTYIEKEIILNYEKRNVKFITLCDVCKRYAEVIGATPSYLDNENSLMYNEFYRSNIDFGSFERKYPLIILNNEMAIELSKQKFKGLYFKNIIKI
jgi:hypothetical protein